MIIGFTGTSIGMTAEQKTQVRGLLTEYKALGAVTFMHGLCIGADEQAARIAKELGYRVVAHPGYSLKNPKNRLFRSDFRGNDEVRPEEPFIRRDRNMVNESHRMIAAPRSKEEEMRSGTWTTVRYAKKKKKPMDMVYP
jgi:hypothetical protein